MMVITVSFCWHIMLIMLGLLFQFLIISRLYSTSTRNPNELINNKKGFPNLSPGAHYLKLEDYDEDEYSINEKVLFDLNDKNEIYSWSVNSNGK
jgi:hypothetical protein